MTTFSSTSLLPLDAGKEYYEAYNETGFPNKSNICDYQESSRITHLEEYIWCVFTGAITLEGYIVPGIIILICIWGLLGNGIVIWLLGFCIKRNPFTTYILNLAIADFGLLTASFSVYICFIAKRLFSPLPYEIIENVFILMYNAGQFLLTAISIDRCVSVLFPLWYRCHRPPHFSTAVCALIWGLSFLLPGIHFTLYLAVSTGYNSKSFQFVVNGFICLPLMTISTLILFIKVCCISKQRRWEKLLKAILPTLLFFIIFAFPINAYFISVYVFHAVIIISPFMLHSGYLSTYLNSSINPLIYLLVGREKRGRRRKSMKAILQNVFKEEENSTVELETSDETQL